MHRKVLIISYSNHAREPRVLMQIKALKKQFEITTAGFSGCEQVDVAFIELNKEVDRPLFSFHTHFKKWIRVPFTIANKIYYFLTGKSQTYSRTDFDKLCRNKFDLIISHHPDSLELAFRLKNKFGCKLFFNAHEIYPNEFENDSAWMERNHERIDNILRRFLLGCECVFTVNKEISHWYEEKYGCISLAIHNSKPYMNLKTTFVEDPIKIIHHGGAMPQRNLEQMAEAVLACNGKYELTFILMETVPSYYREIKEKYEPLGIKFVPPVNYNDIIPTINAYDIGLYILPNDTINHDLALPNKVFEFLQARLAIITSPNKGLRKFVLENGVGLVSEGFDKKDMTKLLMSLNSEQIQKFKQTSNKVALKLSSENDESRILETVKSVLK